MIHLTFNIQTDDPNAIMKSTGISGNYKSTEDILMDIATQLVEFNKYNYPAGPCNASHIDSTGHCAGCGNYRCDCKH